ncbi:MAG TPA: Hsp20/alpha crystallin family protein [Casimicrobiaceae bacterium]|nr:Hsp20/alpha crystallin family protein [Casimicrobiaceae bacterium]
MASLQIYDPFADPTVETLLRSFFRPERAERASPRSFPIDVAETENGYVVAAELPGVTKDEIHVAIEGNQVTIAAEIRRRADSGDTARVVRNERYYGNVYRSFALPVELDDAASEAKYENGLLTLTLVKKPAAAGRKLTIQ